MYVPLTDSNLLSAIKAEVTNGKPRIVTAEILFDEDGNMMTYIIDSKQLHRKRGADIQSILGRVTMSLIEGADPPKQKRRRVAAAVKPK